MVVRLMIHHPEWIPAVSKEEILGDFESPILKKIAEELEGLSAKGGKLRLPEVLDRVGEDLKGKLCEFAFQEGVSEGDQGKILKDCIEKIRQRRWKGSEAPRKTQEDQRG